MIPKFDIYHENLHASYIQFDRYLAYLKNEFINGFVLAQDNAVKHYFFLFEGELQSAFCIFRKEEQTMINSTDASKVAKSSFVSTYLCPINYMDYFSRFQAARMVYHNISTRRVTPEKLFKKFGADRFTGFIEKKSETVPSKNAYLYFNKGHMIGGLNLNAKDGRLENKLDDQKMGAVINGSLFNIYAIVHQVRNQGEEREQILNCYQLIFQMMEDHTSPVQFSTLWRQCARQLSNEHEILDPLIARFQYKDRQISLNDKINIHQALPAMNALIGLIAERISVPVEAINRIKNKYSKLLAAYEHSH